MASSYRNKGVVAVTTGTIVLGCATNPLPLASEMTASINHFLALIGLFGGAIGVAFFFAAMKIKGEISLEVAKQISEISISQLKGQFEDSRLAQLLLELKGEIAANKAELIQQRQEIDQILGFLASKGFSLRRRSRLEGEEQS